MKCRNGIRISVVVLCSLVTNLILAGSSNSLMDISTDGKLLACTNRDSGTVTILELPEMNVRTEIPVGKLPEGVTFIGATHTLAVAVYGDDVIQFIDGDTGEVTSTLQVFDEPYSIVSNKEGSKLWATLDYPGEILEIDAATREITRSAQIGKFTRGLAFDHDDSLLVTEYYTGLIKSVDAQTLTVNDEWKGTSQDNLVRQITTHPTRNKAYFPFQRSLTTVNHGAGSIFPYLGIIDTKSEAEKRRRRVQMDSFRGVYVVANPWEVAVTPDGNRLFIIFAGTNDMFVCDVTDDNYTEVNFSRIVRLGWNPRAIKVSPDGSRFYVYNALDISVSAFSTQDGEKLSTKSVTQWNGTEEQLLGKRLFYTALPPMTLQKWISCSSCHPDGDSDGRTWQQPEGLRNTQALFGMKETYPIHWSADRDEVQDFEHTLRSPLMQSRGLIKGKVHDALGEPNAGRSPELDAIAAYANSHDFKLSPHAKAGLSEAALRGKTLFFSEQTSCATCHSGRYYTDQQMHDVGTGHDDPTELMGSKYDTPTLLGIYRTAPYLHHGKAETLLDVLTTTNAEDKHGKTSHLSPEQLADLVEYLKALPFDKP
ncbi:beta-propeller fold lactonase family protein [Planctomicrobium sp. SH668]|uniref:beta-propeller fold lactonase family protein n=1 Tax=Planctomicrobium sp. SH668 TaxID=3448126 RepID=UPI003F5C62F7